MIRKCMDGNGKRTKGEKFDFDEERERDQSCLTSWFINRKYFVEN